jgi:hypothetical protein
LRRAAKRIKKRAVRPKLETSSLPLLGEVVLSGNPRPQAGWIDKVGRQLWWP